MISNNDDPAIRRLDELSVGYHPAGGTRTRTRPAGSNDTGSTVCHGPESVQRVPSPLQPRANPSCCFIQSSISFPTIQSQGMPIANRLRHGSAGSAPIQGQTQRPLKSQSAYVRYQTACVGIIQQASQAGSPVGGLVQAYPTWPRSINASSSPDADSFSSPPQCLVYKIIS